MSSKTYRQTAREFRAQAAREDDLASRTVLLESAREYDRLADAADQLAGHFAFAVVPPSHPKPGHEHPQV